MKKNDKKVYYEYRIRYKDPITQKFREKSKKGFLSSKEAQLAAAEEEKRIMEGFEISSISLKDYLDYWLNEHKKDTIRRSTYENKEQNIRLHILPYFKNVQLKDVKPMMYQKFINHLASQGYSKSLVEINHTIMYEMFKRAIIDRKIEYNPCEGATIKGKVNEKDLQFIDSNDVGRFLQEAYKYEYNYWIFFKALIDTGMRKGEAAALQWTDIDLKERTISITKSFDFQKASKDKNLMFGDTKTYHSVRTIKISQSLANDFHFQIKYQNQNKLTLNEIYHHDLNLVFCRNDGNYLPKSTLFNAFSRILKRAGLSSLPIHSLRHTHAVLALEAGVDMKTLQERLGHGSYQVTADVYSHVSKKMEITAIDKYEEYTKNVY
ncbi:site-specific integrase [Bacillus sp. MRMR6]|nr:site-specific integrase [Bacillus sp. MRMR6]